MKLSRVILFTVAVSISPVFGQGTVKQAPMRGVNRSAAKPAAPAVLVGINATVGTIAEPSWPLIVTASVYPETQSTAAPSLPSDLQIRMTNESGGAVAINFEAVTPPSPTGAGPGRYWVATESATSALVPGRYRVTVVSSATTWRIIPGEIQVLAPDPQRSGLLPLLRIQRLLLQGRADDALAEADRAIAANAANIQAWIAKGEILMKKDDPDGAVEAYDRALALHRATGRDSFPILTRRKSAHVRALEKRGVAVPAVTPP